MIVHAISVIAFGLACLAWWSERQERRAAEAATAAAREAGAFFLAELQRANRRAPLFVQKPGRA